MNDGIPEIKALTTGQGELLANIARLLACLPKAQMDGVIAVARSIRNTNNKKEN